MSWFSALVHQNFYLMLVVFHHKICVFIIFIFFLVKKMKMIKTQISATKYQPIRNVNWWFPTISGTV